MTQVFNSKVKVTHWINRLKTVCLVHDSLISSNTNVYHETVCSAQDCMASSKVMIKVCLKQLLNHSFVFSLINLIMFENNLS